MQSEPSSLFSVYPKPLPNVVDCKGFVVLRISFNVLVISFNALVVSINALRTVKLCAPF